MSSEPKSPEQSAALLGGVALVCRSGPRTGVRYAVTSEHTRVGRGTDNDIVLDGPDAVTVSARHFEILRDAHGFRIRDLGSTNGTFVNGQQISEIAVTPPAMIQLGATGPQFTFAVEETPVIDLNQTVVIHPDDKPAPAVVAAPLNSTYDGLLTDAVARARQARSRGLANETMMIMRETLQFALHRNTRRSRRIIVALVAVLIAVSGFAAWKIYSLRTEKAAIDRHIHEIEARLQQAPEGGEEADRLATQLDAWQGEAQQLQSNLLFRIAAGREDFVTREIRILLAEFGAEAYSVPPEFTARVKHYLEQYQGPDRPLMQHALTDSQAHFSAVRSILESEQLPPDLAYIPVVESAVNPDQTSSAGAAGPWQFTPATARAYGLRVNDEVDERLDLRKSTRAGCRYLRELILDFGAGSSVMLALAAYNSGPAKVKQAVVRTVRDPIKQRNFWYLYRVRALPAETREYVPKVIAVMIIGRNAEHFGFTRVERASR